MKLQIRAVVLGVSVLAAGCGSSPRGTATLSGGLGTLTLSNVYGSASPLLQTWTFHLDVEARELPTFNFGLSAIGATLPTGVSTPSNSLGSMGQLQAYDGASQSENTDSFYVMTGSNVYGVQRGTFELNLTSIGNAEQQTGYPVWQNVHGTFTATLTPEPTNGPPGAADVTLNATF